jgi:hypothetical protein
MTDRSPTAGQAQQPKRRLVELSPSERTGRRRIRPAKFGKSCLQFGIAGDFRVWCGLRLAVFVVF